MAHKLVSKLAKLWREREGGKGTFEQRDEVSFNGFLQSADGAGLESQVSLEILSDFSDETLETGSQNRESWRLIRKFANEQFSRFLVTTDFSESDGTGTVTMRFLDTARSLEMKLVDC